MRKEFRVATAQHSTAQHSTAQHSTAQAVSLLCKKMESSIVIYADTKMPFIAMR